MSLWPEEYLAKLPIEPAIPSNFVLKNISKELSGYFLWGPKEVLDSYDIQDPKSLSASLFYLYTSFEVAQKGPQSFLKENEMEKSLKDLKITDLSKKLYMWGKYPVLTFDGKRPNGRDLLTAWVGLNYCSNVLVVKLAHPESEGRPNDEDRALWQTFLSNSKELPEPDRFLAQGYDMETGYTYFNPNGENLLCIAEKRTDDKKTLQVVIFPLNKDTTFSFLKLETGLAGTQWRYGEKIVKLFLSVTKKLPEGGSINSTNCPITIFLKTVDQFSLDKKVLQLMPGVFVSQEKKGLCT
jgi:hypothetical protein